MGSQAGIQFELESPSGYHQVAHVTIAAEHVELRRERTAREIAAKIKLPGFRKGKVPVKLVRTRFAADGVYYTGAVCATCNVPKPARSKHCSMHGRCVRRVVAERRPAALG